MDMTQEHKAKAIYQEALDLATKGLSDQSNGGYRRVTEEVGNADAKLLQEWMISPLLTLIDKSTDNFNTAFAYLDLARLQSRLQQNDAAKIIMNLGMTRAQRLPSNGLKTVAINQLTAFALEIGDVEFAKRYGDQKQLIASNALYESAKGNRREALAFTSKLGNGMYVGWRTETQAKLISNAIKRHDVDSAIFYAEQFSDLLLSEKMKAWTQIAELQTSQGDRKAATLSFTKAINTFGQKTESEYFNFEIMAELALGKSLIQNGLNTEGNQVFSSAIHHSRTIPRRRMQDRISIKVNIANALNLVKRTAEAKKLIADAYLEAHNFPQDQQFVKMHQASLLSEIALAAAKLGLK